MDKDDYGGCNPTNSLSDIQSVDNVFTFKKEVRKIRIFNWFCNFADMVHYRGILPTIFLSLY